MLDVNKCEMTVYPAPILSRQTRPIEKVDDTIRALADKMIDIMLEYRGIGLAGPQAGVDLSIFVICMTGRKEDAKVFINPHVEGFGRSCPMQEGCLSFPGIYTKIKRPGHDRVTALDREGNEFSEEADGLYAKCLQHEFDHLNGVTIYNRMGRLGQLRHKKELEKLRTGDNEI